MDIEVNQQEMTVSVLVESEVVKTEDIDKEEFKEYIHELCKDDLMLEALRLTARKMKPKSYLFKEIE